MGGFRQRMVAVICVPKKKWGFASALKMDINKIMCSTYKANGYYH